MSNLGNFYIEPSDVDNIPKFVDSLPILPVPKPISYHNCLNYQNYNPQNHYKITTMEYCNKFHSNFPSTYIWGYDGMYPCPTIDAYKDIPTFVEWVNNLPDKHFLPFGTTLHGTQYDPEVKTVVHLHGSNNAIQSY